MTDITEWKKKDSETRWVSIFAYVAVISCFTGFLWGDNSGLALPLMPFLMATLVAIFGPLTFLRQFEKDKRRRFLQALGLFYVPLCIVAFMILLCPAAIVPAFKNVIFRYYFIGDLFWNAIWSILLYNTKRTFTKSVIIWWVIIPFVWILMIGSYESFALYNFVVYPK